jgi:lysophospholipase L1-like esterase
MAEVKSLRFAVAAILMSTLGVSAVCIGGFLLVERPTYRMLGSLRQINLVRAYLFNAKIRRFARTLREQDPRTDLFATLWDTSTGVLLSRHLYRSVMMDGVQKYAYEPNLNKLGFWVSASGVSWKMETEDTPSIRAAIADLDTQLMVTASYDEFGFRRTDPALARDCQVHALFLGDSFTDGLWVGDGDTFANRYAWLARERSSVRLCPVNAGVNGYGSFEERYVLEHAFEAAGRPSLVFVMYFPNDVDANYAAVVSDRIPNVERLWRASLDELRRMHHFALAHQSTLVVAAIPHKEQLLHHETQAHYQDVLRAFCAREGIAFVNIFDGFAAGDTRALYWPSDPHFTPHGHQVVAELLYDATRGLLE